MKILSQKNCNIEERKGKHIKERERYTIEDLLKEKLTPKEIAKRLGRHVRTIEREIKRGAVDMLGPELKAIKKYCADTGQRKYNEASSNKGPTLKIGYDHELVKHIEEKIKKEHYSPDAVIGAIKTGKIKFKTTICTKTLYNYIDRNLFLNISNKDLPVKKDGKTRTYKRIKVALHNTKGTSIEQRPIKIESREEFGDWEMDCVNGKQGTKAALLVLTERKTRQEQIFKLKDKTQKSVVNVLNKLERQNKKNFKRIYKTITVDNGSEFLNFEELEKSIYKKDEKRTKIYYAHPYSAWERGTNENLNKMIRRFIPKGTDISKISIQEIKNIEHWINNYPRKILNYKTSNDVYKEHVAA